MEDLTHEDVLESLWYPSTKHIISPLKFFFICSYLSPIFFSSYFHFRSSPPLHHLYQYHTPFCTTAMPFLHSLLSYFPFLFI